MILAIDPGPTKSGWVYIEARDGTERVIAHGHEANVAVREKIRELADDGGLTAVVIEDCRLRGQRAGYDLEFTLKWIGRFHEVVFRWCGFEAVVMPRSRVCYILTGDESCGDAGVRINLLDRYGPGKVKAVGFKASPGPLYGLRVHEYAALALAIAYVERPPEKSLALGQADPTACICGQVKRSSWR